MFPDAVVGICSFMIAIRITLLDESIMLACSRRILSLLFAGALLAVSSTVAHSQAAADQWNAQSAKQIEDGIEKKHPAAYFILAKKLFEEGKKDEATFWFYVGQIRYRAYLRTNPNLNPSGDPALFSSLFSVLGPVINSYAFGDTPGLVKTIDRALDWDAKNADSFTPKSPARDEVRAGLMEIKKHIVIQQEDIRMQRKSKGLENRN
jgi:hypothetical protein